MACAKPPDPATITPATRLTHPAASSAASVIRDLTALIRSNPSVSRVERAAGRAEFLLEQARKACAPDAELRRLEELIRTLKGEGHQVMRASLEPRFDVLARRLPSAITPKNTTTAIRALSSNDHWASGAYQSNLLAIIERNGRIPSAYKPQLRHDVAKVLEMCPHAGGLVRELTLRGQRGATGSASKIGSKSNVAVGAAYELMGTAALGSRISQAVNGGPSLHIQSGFDIVTFGDKCYLNGRGTSSKDWSSPSRRTIECDVRIGRRDDLGLEYREIGIDFKHTKEMGTKHSSRDFCNQLENVVLALEDRHLHEYHFVTNGTFGSGVLREVAAANEKLVAMNRTPIGLHEHVTTLVNDPTAVLG